MNLRVCMYFNVYSMSLFSDIQYFVHVNTREIAYPCSELIKTSVRTLFSHLKSAYF